MWQSAVLPFSFTGKENNEFFIKSAEKYEKNTTGLFIAWIII